MKKNKALFLDRDGVINEDIGYPSKPEDIHFCNGIFELCKAAISKGYIIIIVTNQAGVAKGYFTEEDVEKLHQWMKEEFLSRGIIITAFYYCPYHPEAKILKYKKDDDCRKPKPGMFIKAVQDYNIDLSSSLMVGDKPSDRIELPELRCVIIKSKYTQDNYDVESLYDVINLL
ncbi:MAG: HAD family hydrolase [Chitinispirillaceae bacterium]|nr:HAD family hydrolase [Chitinispirillaceae bacterium]